MRTRTEVGKCGWIISVGDQDKFFAWLLRISGADAVEGCLGDGDDSVAGFHCGALYLSRASRHRLVAAENEFLNEIIKPFVTYIGNGAEMRESPS